MAAELGVAAPAGGLAVGVAALALWVSAVPWRWLDLVVALLFVAGIAAAAVAYARGRDARTRRFAVVALGWNAVGLVALVLLYTAG